MSGNVSTNHESAPRFQSNLPSRDSGSVRGIDGEQPEDDILSPGSVTYGRVPWLGPAYEHGRLLSDQELLALAGRAFGHRDDDPLFKRLRPRKDAFPKPKERKPNLRALKARDAERARQSIAGNPERSLAQRIIDDMRLSPSRELCPFGMHVYFIHCRDWVKVGKALSVPGRLASLQVGNPEPLELMGSFYGLSCDEAFLHRALVQTAGLRRGSGEWFEISPIFSELIAILSAK